MTDQADEALDAIEQEKYIKNLTQPMPDKKSNEVEDNFMENLLREALNNRNSEVDYLKNIVAAQAHEITELKKKLKKICYAWTKHD